MRRISLLVLLLRPPLLRLVVVTGVVAVMSAPGCLTAAWSLPVTNRRSGNSVTSSPPNVIRPSKNKVWITCLHGQPGRLQSQELAMFAPIFPLAPLTPIWQERIGNKRCQTFQNLGGMGEESLVAEGNYSAFNSKCGLKPHFNRCLYIYIYIGI